MAGSGRRDSWIRRRRRAVLASDPAPPLAQDEGTAARPSAPRKPRKPSACALHLLGQVEAGTALQEKMSQSNAMHAVAEKEEPGRRRQAAVHRRRRAVPRRVRRRHGEVGEDRDGSIVVEWQDEGWHAGERLARRQRQRRCALDPVGSSSRASQLRVVVPTAAPGLRVACLPPRTGFPC